MLLLLLESEFEVYYKDFYFLTSPSPIFIQFIDKIFDHGLYLTFL